MNNSEPLPGDTSAAACRVACLPSCFLVKDKGAALATGGGGGEGVRAHVAFWLQSKRTVLDVAEGQRCVHEGVF